MSVFADPEIAQRAQRGHLDLGICLELVSTRPGGGLSQPSPDLLANAWQQMVQPTLEGWREKLHALKCCLSYRCGVFAGESCVVGTSCPNVCLAAHFRQ
jgi:hypothetical protein